VAKSIKEQSTGGKKPGSRPSRDTEDVIPVLRPLLPSAERLLPYLRMIDATRTYSNWGPLACEFERRMAEHFHLPGYGVISASSGTVALIGAVLATAGKARPDRPIALIPAFTFVATATAVERCGYQPYLADINPESWLLDPQHVLSRHSLDRVGLVVPVSAFGRPVLQEEWLAFQRRSGVPVVIDGAASFEALSVSPASTIGEIPVALSHHATKSFATAEGGCVLTTDLRLSVRTTEALNFGFYADRESRSASINGKMSEYHAAIGLAELDGWPRKRQALSAVAERYRQRMTAVDLRAYFVSAPEVAGCYALFCCSSSAQAARVRRRLAEAGVEFRSWYGSGLLAQPYFSDLSHGALDVTESIAPLVIGLPVAVDLTDSAIARVVATIERGVRGDDSPDR